MAGRLEDKIAFITGAGRGIGRAVAQKMAEEGAAVVIAERDAKAGERAARELSQSGHRALFVNTDITDEQQVQAAISQAASHFGQLHILVNNAGVNFYFNATQMSSADWDQAMAVDLKGAWMCAKYAIPRMVEASGGVIINIASVHSSMTTYNMFPYAVAKAGLVGMTRSLALDWARQNIRVLAVSPGWVGTELVEKHFERELDPQLARQRVNQTIPIGRIGTPRDIANLVAFLASDEASYMTGTEIMIEGGITARYAE